MKYKKFLIIIPIILIGVLAVATSIYLQKYKNIAPTKSHAQEVVKVKLVIQLDQSMSNGVIVNADPANPLFVEALGRFMDTIKKFQSNYDVYVLLNPMIKDKSKLVFVLDKLKENNIKFMLDDYASDILHFGQFTAVPFNNEQRTIFNDIVDFPHGIALKPAGAGVAHDEKTLDYYVERYGTYFGGIRLFEIVPEDTHIASCYLNFDSNLCEASTTLAYHTDPGASRPLFYHKSLAEELIKFAWQNHMFVEWSDNDFYDSYGHANLPSGEWRMAEEKNDMVSLAQTYPQTIYPTFANNLGANMAKSVLPDWQSYIPISSDFAGKGLNDQSWLCTDANAETTCPVQYLIDWTQSAISTGAKLIQLEPFYYFFNWPRFVVTTYPILFNNTTNFINCDWNGDGKKTPAEFSNGKWKIRNSNTSGAPDVQFAFGFPSDIPICGDWDGNGTQKPGVFRNNQFFLKNNMNPSDSSFTSFYFGVGGTPVVGHWNGGKKDTVGTYNKGEFYLSSDNQNVFAHFFFGPGGSSKPVVGDWNGDGKTKIGIFQGNSWYLKSDSDPNSSATTNLSYGLNGDLPIAGDWDGNKTDTVGTVRGNTWHLKNTNITGDPEIDFVYGDPTINIDWSQAGLPTQNLIQFAQSALGVSLTTTTATTTPLPTVTPVQTASPLPSSFNFKFALQGARTNVR